MKIAYRLAKFAVFLPLIPLAPSLYRKTYAEKDIQFEEIKKMVFYQKEYFSPKDIVGKKLVDCHSKKLREILKKSSEEVQVSSGIVSKYTVCFYNGNECIEDTFAVSSNKNEHLFGVFDGHGGTAASKFCMKELFSFLSYYKKNHPESSLINSEAFKFADDCFLKLAIRENRLKDAASGACAVVAHVKNKKLNVANLGDCRCVVGEIVGEKGALKAIEMTKDHQIDTNEIERERLLANHPNEASIIRRSRVKGRLQPTRGFGDGKYKRIEIYDGLKKEKPSRNTEHIWNPPYTNAEPDITERELTKSAKFMVLATDGIFENLSSQQVVDCVGGFITSKGSKENNGLNASAVIIEKSMEVAAEKSFGRLDQGKHLENLVNIEAGPMRRALHDDMTVLVVFFQDEKKEGEYAEEQFNEPETLVKLKKLIKY